MQFESLRMKEDENITSFFLCVDEIVNIIKGLDEAIVVQKVFRSLPSRLNPIEELKYLEKLSMDQRHGILTTYEIRTIKEKLGSRETTFKLAKKTHDDHDCSSHE